jgi:hypothetical protein
LRYFAIFWTSPARPENIKRIKYREDWLEDWYNASSEEEKRRIAEKYGGYPL